MGERKSSMEGVGNMNIKKGTHVLVTGGTGFVGSHVIEALLKRGAHVITTYVIEDPLSYFKSKGFERKVTKVRFDVRDCEGMKHLIARFNVEYVLHLAAQPLVDVALENPLYTLDTNIMGTVAVLEASRVAKSVRGVIVASSDKAYGKHGIKKYAETDRLQGDHPYEVSKSAADLICTSYMHTYALPVVTTRFGNIYGEGDMNLSRIIPGIMDAVINKRSLEIRSDGTYVRDYLYVKDVARGYLQLLDSFHEAQGNAFNFGSKETLSVLEVVKTLEKVLRRKVSYKLLNTASNEIPYQSLDFAKIKKKIGWVPRYTLKRTIPGMYRWYKKALKQ